MDRESLLLRKACGSIRKSASSNSSLRVCAYTCHGACCNSIWPTSCPEQNTTLEVHSHKQPQSLRANSCAASKNDVNKARAFFHAVALSSALTGAGRDDGGLDSVGGLTAGQLSKAFSSARTALVYGGPALWHACSRCWSSAHVALMVLTRDSSFQAQPLVPIGWSSGQLAALFNEYHVPARETQVSRREAER